MSNASSNSEADTEPEWRVRNMDGEQVRFDPDPSAHVTPNSATKSIYTPAQGAKCVHCGKPATIYCPICKRNFCDGPCLEVH